MNCLHSLKASAVRLLSKKDNFKYKVFENVGLEWGAYNKAFDYLNLDDDTIVFCIQDDMVIKDWSFISVCVEHINKGIKIISRNVLERVGGKKTCKQEIYNLAKAKSYHSQVLKWRKANFDAYRQLKKLIMLLKKPK